MESSQHESENRGRATKPKRKPLFACQECGKKFYTVGSATRASFNGCRCGGVDIDLYVESEGGNER